MTPITVFSRPPRLDPRPVTRRVGLVALSTDHRSEVDYARILCPAGIGVHVNRIPFANPVTPGSLRRMEGYLAQGAADIPPGEDLDAVIFGCTSASVCIGDDVVRAQVNAGKPGCPFVTPVSAALAGLRAMGARRISVRPVRRAGGGCGCGGPGPVARLVGVSMERAAATAASLAVGCPVEVREVTMLAESMGGGIGLANRITIAMCQNLLDQVILVPLDMAATDCVVNAFRALATGTVAMLPILRLDLPEHRGEVDVKTAHIPGLDHFAIRIVPGFFGNPARGLPSTNGLMVVLSSRTGLVQALLRDNGFLADVRTAVAPDRSFADLGQVIAGRQPGRLTPHDITLPDLTGTGIQDTAFAALSLTRARIRTGANLCRMTQPRAAWPTGGQDR